MCNNCNCLKFFMFIIWIIIVACNEKDKEFYIYSDLINNQTYIIKLDTFTCENSTIFLDSFVTSGNEKMLIGYYYDTLIGSINCLSVFQIGLPSSYPSYYDQLDSASLIIKTDGYSFGDTTYSCFYEVYSLKEYPDIEIGSGYYYNTTNISVKARIGSKKFKPYPNIDKELSIPIDYIFASELFYGLIEQSDYFQSNDNFLKFLPGLVIKSDSLNTKSIIRYFASSNNLFLRLYIKQKELINESYTIDFPIINTSYQFNIIKHNRTKDINNILQRDKISLLYSGLGIFSRFDFPYLNSLLGEGNFKLLKAVLNFKPYMKYTNMDDLSDSLVLGCIDSQNKIESFFYDSQGNYLFPQLNIDELYNENTWYSFDITSFVNIGINKKWFNPEEGIFICFYPTFLYTTFKHFYIDGNNIRLDLYLLKY